MTVPAPSWAPWKVRSYELSAGLNELHDQLKDLAAQPGPAGAWVLGRVFGEPVGWIKVRFEAFPPSPEELRDRVDPTVAERVGRHLSEAGISLADGLVPLTEVEPAVIPAYVARRETALLEGPAVTAVICTRDRPEGLATCLSSLQAQDYPRLSILVVDNAPTGEGAAEVARSSEGPFEVAYVLEPRAGLSWARNRSLDVVDTEVVAWIDDDEIADTQWVTELAGAFLSDPAASAVCGIMLPGELESPAQELFEQYGGHSKGRGFEAAAFSPATRAQQHPLFPLPPFGTGGNMAMRKGATSLFGRFDPALGAGTYSKGAEDTRALTDILLGGGTVRYEPSAMTWHYHRKEMHELEHQLHSYGVGLAAFYMSIVIDKPRMVPQLVRLLPTALREFSSSDGARLGDINDSFPRHLLRANRRGLLKGPLQYARARRSARQIASTS